MRKPTGHKEKYSIKSEISKCFPDNETAARTRPFSFDEIMLRRKNKKKSGNVEDHRAVSEVVGFKEAESVFDRLESGGHRHRHRDVGGDSERKDFKDGIKTRENKIVEREYKETKNAHIRSKIVSDNVKDRTNERVVHEQRKNQDRSTNDIDYGHGKRHGKETEVKDRDINVERKREKSENVSKRTENRYDERGRDHDAGKKHDTRNGYDSNTSERKGTSEFYYDLKSKYYERDRNQDVGKKHDSRKLYDSNTSEKKQHKGTSEFHNEDLKLKYAERDRDQDAGKKHEPRKLYDSNTSERKQQKETFESHHEELKSKYDERDRNHDVGKKHDSRNLYDSSTSKRKQQKGTSESHRENSELKYDMQDRDQDVGKRHEPRKLNDSSTSERNQQKRTSETHPEDLKSRSKRSRSREDERGKRKKSNSPSPRGQKQRLFETREHEVLSSNNGSSNKSKRHDTSAHRLGGYSPRKRRIEAAVKTPSPIIHSPEKKNTTWDSPPVKMESNLPLLNKTEVSNKHEVSNLDPFTPTTLKPSFGVISSIPFMMNASVDSVQLTQATRPKRRIYVENLPSSASEAAVIQWLTGYLRPYGVNHVQSMSPCISCIVNKEKGQALVEFLTPEDASTALRFDGRSFSGSILKIRRPKDYVEATTGVSEKPVTGAVSVRNIVEDSSNKIFIGGISKVITSEMLMEIASAFGPLKAFHFDNNTFLDSHRAFVEYADQSVTVKACVGLNGMKLGGQVLTVTQATPDASSVGNHGDQPFYGTPVHAQPLLEKPTPVLKLNNVLDPHSLPSLSESELEELLEDIRLECARFGIVKSIHITKQTDMLTSSKTFNESKEATSTVNEITQPLGNDLEQQQVVEEPAHVDGTIKPENLNKAVGANAIVDNKHENKIMKNETVENQNLDENPLQISHEIDPLESNDIKSTDDTATANKKLKAEIHDSVKDVLSDSNVNFEAGCVLVEYKRTVACSMAAHGLHGRVFDGRTVTVEYVAHAVYCTRFANEFIR